MSSTLVWNSRAIPRALPISLPTARSAPGSSLGPMKTSAVTPISASCAMLKSNIVVAAEARSDLGVLPGLRARAHGRAGGDLLRRRAGDVGLGVLVALLEALLEGGDALPELAEQVLDLAAAEQQHHDCQN